MKYCINECPTTITQETNGKNNIVLEVLINDWYAKEQEPNQTPPQLELITYPNDYIEL